MIQIIPTTIGGTSPALYGVQIDETLCYGYSTENVPTVTVSATNNGGLISAGGVTMQKITFAVTVVYQPCERCSDTKVRTFAETVTVSVPGSVTSITPTANTSINVIPTKICGSKANGVRILTSVSVAYA